jgi:hypothetical protein
VTLPLYETILDIIIETSTAFTEGYRDFTLSEMEEGDGVKLRLPYSKSPLGLILSTVAAGAVLLIASIILSIRASKAAPLGSRMVEV